MGSEQPTSNYPAQAVVSVVSAARDGVEASARRCSEARELRAMVERRHQRLLGVRDGVVAALTIPTHRRPSRCPHVGTVASPAVRPELWRLHIGYARSGDGELRTRLLRHYEGHARSLAKRFYRHREPLDDLMQVALEGLLVALDRFDPLRSRPFLAYASPTICGLLKHHYRDSGWAVRVPRRVHEMARPVREAAELLTQDLGRPGSVSEVADLLGVDEWQVREAQAAEEARATASLDAPLGDGSGTLGGAIGDADPSFAQVENRETLLQALRLLPDADRRLLHMYFEQEMTQSRIAEELGVSQMQVSRTISSAVRRLRSRIPAD